jgi:P27 family predicted phage terminase small subunit
MSKGRKPKPLVDHVMQGTYRADRHAGRGISAPAGPMDAPADFDATQRREWEGLISASAPGHFKPLDHGMMRAWCLHMTIFNATWARLRKCGKLVEVLTVAGQKGGVGINPLIKLLQDESATLRLIAETLGLSPTARERVKPSEDPQGELNLGLPAGAAEPGSDPERYTPEGSAGFDEAVAEELAKLEKESSDETTIRSDQS